MASTLLPKTSLDGLHLMIPWTVRHLNRCHVVTTLLAYEEAKTTINDKDKYGCTALSWAFLMRDQDTTRILLASGADTTAARLERALPLYWILMEDPNTAMLVVRAWIDNNYEARNKRAYNMAPMYESKFTVGHVVGQVPEAVLRGWFDLTCRAALDGIIIWEPNKEHEDHWYRMSPDLAGALRLDNAAYWEFCLPTRMVQPSTTTVH